MRKASAWIALLFAAGLSSAGAFAAELVIENVTVLSPEQAAPLRNRHVLIQDERIARISDRPIASKAARRIDGHNKFLTPGLMDAHVHVSDAAGLPYGSNDIDIAALRAEFFRQQPRSYLFFGVTQLLDPSNDAAGIAAFNAQPQRPDLFRCIAAPALDGYPTVFMDKSIRYRDFPTYIFEPENAAQHPLPAGEEAATHTPEAVIERIAATDARCVKVFMETGFGGASNWPVLSTATLRQVRAAAHAKGLLLMAHANSLKSQRIALDVQVDLLAHGVWNWDEFSDRPGVPDAIAAHLKKIRDQRVGYQPTLRVLYGTADLFRHDTLLDPVYAKVVPAPVLKWYGTEAGQWFKRILRQNYDGAPDMKIMHAQLQTGDQGMRATKYLQQLGQPLLLGSDTPSSPTYGSQPGYDTYREMRLMAQAGVPLAAIFQAATINNARQFKLDQDYGTVAPGKIANLLLLDANPLESVRAWSQIDSIVLRGKVIERSSLAVN